MGPRRLAAVLVVVTLSAVALLARREVARAAVRAPVVLEARRVSPDRAAPSAESAPFARAVDEAMASMHREHELDR